MASRVGIVSVCLNDASVLPKFLANKKAWTLAESAFVLVDNGSTDNTVETLQAQESHITIIRPGSNLGTTGGYNQGIRVARDAGLDYVMLLALDVLLAPDSLRVLVAEMDRDPEIGVISPLLLKSHDPSLIECLGFTKKGGHSFHANYAGLRLPMDLPPIVETDYVDGGTSLFRISALHQVGLLDENFFMYGEDVDICLRLRREGYKVAATSKTCAWHRHSEIQMADPRPRPWNVYYQHRNLVHLARKHGSPRERRAYVTHAVRGIPRTLAYYALRERSARLGVIYLEALLHGILGKMGKRKYVL